MDAMSEALKKKMGALGGISIEIHPLGDEDAGKEIEIEGKEDDINRSPDMAPQLSAGSQDVVGEPDKMEILKGLADKQGVSGSLGQKAAMGAKAKIAELMKKKK